MTQPKYGFSRDDRGLVVEVLHAAADRYNTLADDLEEDRDDPSKVAAYVSSRLKSEDCRRLAREIEKDMALPHPRKRGNPHGAHPRFGDD
jgi:hypothetical protein